MKTRGEALYKWEKIKKEIIKELKPSKSEESHLKNFAEKTVKKINKILTECDIDALAEVHGSVAHGTWIKGQQDLDVFIVIENYKKHEQLQNVLDIVKDNTKWVFTEAYAEHPYLKTKINGYYLDIVPCFRVKGELYSSTDRTPLHTKWLMDRITGLEDDVRLLKQFLITMDLYGAEIKIGGFSGYLCEILIVHYGSFIELIKEASKWGKKEVIHFPENNKKDFDNPLTFIDPVDKHRNVASALREESYALFVAASRSFLKYPRIIFFRREKQNFSQEIILEELEGRSTDILFLVVEECRADVADVLWGQIHKSRQALEERIKETDFMVLRSSAWSNEETRHIFIYELETSRIPEVMKRLGPPAHIENNVIEFIETYRDNSSTVAGPNLIGDRWFVLVKREYTEIRTLVDHLLSDGGRDIGISRKLATRILQHHRILLNEEIQSYLINGFEEFLYDWLKGRPHWIE